MPDGYQIIPFDVKNLFKNVPLTDQYFHHIETSHLICSANQMTGFYMKCNTGLKRVYPVLLLITLIKYLPIAKTNKQ